MVTVQCVRILHKYISPPPEGCSLAPALAQAVYGPAGKTEMWQPVDAGHVGAIIKALARSIIETHMSREKRPGISNWEAWKMGAYTAKDPPMPRASMCHVTRDSFAVRPQPPCKGARWTDGLCLPNSLPARKNGFSSDGASARHETASARRSTHTCVCPPSWSRDAA